MNIIIEKKSKSPIYIQIADSIRDHIMNGELVYGSVLPSERALSKMLQIHRNTVIKAYLELKDRELIDSKQGVGYQVTFGKPLKPNYPKVASTKEHSVNRASQRPKHVNWESEIKEEFINREKAFDTVFQRYRNVGKITFSSGFSMPSVYKRSELSKDIANIISYDGKSQYFYSPYKGDEGLRQQIASFLSTKGITASSAEIQVVTETNQAIDFITNLLVRPGDFVILSEPVSPDTYRALRLAQARIITIPVDEDGLDVDAIERVISQTIPRAIFVDSSFQDPTTACLSDSRRHMLIDISNKYRIPIVEEDAASELYYGSKSVVPLKAMDTMHNVIYIYSFSLTFVPGLSLAFIVANREVIRSLSYIVSVRFVATDWLTQRLMADYLENGTYHRNVEIFRNSYKAKRDKMLQELEKMNERLSADNLEPVSFKKPEGGVYIWMKLPASIDCRSFDRECYHEGLVIIPGYIFYPFKNGGRNHVRLNYSYEKIENIPKGVQIIESSIRKLISLKNE